MALATQRNARHAAKAQIERITTWASVNKDIADNVFLFQDRIDVLKDNFKKYNESQDKIENLITQNDIDDEDRVLVETNYFDTLSILREGVKRLTRATSNTSDEVSVSKIQLPEIKISPFDGDPTQWKSFFDLFDALIIKNSRLTANAERLFYLKSFLRGHALEIVASLPISDDNFEIAIDLLKKRYENVGTLSNGVFHRLLNQPAVSKHNSQNLRTFLDSTRKNLDSLKNLQTGDKETFEAFLVFLLEQKLDFYSKKEFEKARDLSKLPSLDQFVGFLEKHCVIADNLNSLDYVNDKKFTKPIKTVSLHTNSSDNVSKPSKPCTYCNNSSHKIYTCKKFTQLSPRDRHSFIKGKQFCYNCLTAKHSVEHCTSSYTCQVCNKKHNSLLHLDKTHPDHPRSQSKQSIQLQSNADRNLDTSFRPVASTSGRSGQVETAIFAGSNSQSQNSSIERVNLSSLSSHNEHVLLATCKAIVYPKNKSPLIVKILLDPGSQTSFISRNIFNKLGFRPYRQELTISGLGNSNASTSNQMLDVTLHSRVNKNKNILASCAVVETITANLPQVPIRAHELNIPHEILENLGDDEFFKPSHIDILLGADCYYNLLKSGLYKLGTNLPVLLDTHFGWIVSGNIPSKLLDNGHRQSMVSHSFLITNSPECVDSRLDFILEKFWKQEEVQNTSYSMSPEDELAEKIFTSTTKVLENGTFQVNMPLKNSSAHAQLGDSYCMAKKRFLILEKRFERDPQLFLDYKNFVTEYLALGHAKVIPLSLVNVLNENKYFIPHLCVVRNESSSTKLRVVFDFSAKTTSSLSLNDITLKGPQVHPELFDILIRFRTYKYALTCDIEKMFRQVRMNPEQNFLQNILWRESPDKPLLCLELQTVSFGQSCSPFLSCRVIKEIALRNSNLDLASEVLLSQTYVDDVLGGTSNLTELERLYTQLNTILNEAGFRLHKWCFNSTEFLGQISNSQTSDLDLNFENSPCKILGLKWNPASDNLKISAPSSLENNPITKRKILSIISSCYDPLGLVNPCIVLGKVIMQKLWLQKLEWDTPIEDPILLKDWTKFFCETLLALKTLEIPRYLFDDKKIAEVQLHGFSDASNMAYGCVVYLRVKYTDDSVSCNLVSSKSRVAPIRKTVTIPRLELSAMLLLANLVSRILFIFQNKIEIESVNLWTDSQIALYWIKSHPYRWTTFVSNRVSQLQELCGNYFWRHVSSALNSADILSRGFFERKNLDFWFHGPSFLRNPTLDVTQIDSYAPVENPPEEKKISLLTSAKHETFWNQIIARFSKLSSLRRTVAYLFRMAHNYKNKDAKLSGPLQVSELDKALLFLVKQIQSEHFASEISDISRNKSLSNRQIASLNPFLDATGLLRVGGRLQCADIPFDQKHPILLPSKNYFVQLLLKQEHLRLGHCGPQNLLCNIRLRFWPLNGLRQIKRILKDCVTCHRFKAASAQQIMSHLPPDRVLRSRPFQKVGIDFGGPFLIRTSRLRKAQSIKCYIAIFVCMVTKAIHAELVTGLSANAFILTLKRFVARRGQPSVIYSDNGTNFVGARNQLYEVYKFFNSSDSLDHIRDFLAQNETCWKFIPPRSPHWGGLWESAIKSAKYHLHRLVGASQFTYEEFSTVLAQVEAILNSRPLYALSNDPNDLSPLTPGHFLIGSPLTAYPEKDVSATPTNRLSFWVQCSKVQQNFWKKWTVEYLNRLQNRPKWLHPLNDLKINDVVLLKDEDTPPLKWPLARILETIKGKDGHVRVVRLRTSDGEFTRPITKICPLPLSPSMEASESFESMDL